MDAEFEKKLEESLAALTQMYRQKEISDEVYYKAVVTMAYEYANDGQALRAAAMVQGVPLEYFREHQRPQMTEDPVYAARAYTLALALLQEGLVHLGPAPVPTMGVAKA